MLNQTHNYFWQTISRVCRRESISAFYLADYDNGKRDYATYDIMSCKPSSMLAVIGYILSHDIQNATIWDILNDMINDPTSPYTQELMIEPTGLIKYAFNAKFDCVSRIKPIGYDSQIIFNIMYRLCNTD